MHRFWFDGEVRDGLARIEGEEARHAGRVLRLRAGAQIELLDGRGGLYRAVLEEVSAERCTARVAETLPGREASVCVTLFQGLPKADKMEWILQKATELGVHAVVPVAFSRCVRENAHHPEKTLARWERVVREAAKQCGRGRIPRVEETVTPGALAQRLPGFGCAVTAWEEAGGLRIADVLRETDPERGVAVVIGPEGGLEAQEVALLQEAGARTVTLGKRILRTETAGLVALASVLTLTGDL